MLFELVVSASSQIMNVMVTGNATITGALVHLVGMETRAKVERVVLGLDLDQPSASLQPKMQ